jgi:hypothetical protein
MLQPHKATQTNLTLGGSTKMTTPNNAQFDAAAIGATAYEIINQTRQLTDDVTLVMSNIHSIRTSGVDTGALEQAVKQLADTKVAIEAAASSLNDISRPPAPETAPQDDVEPEAEPEGKADSEHQAAAKRDAEQQAKAESKTPYQQKYGHSGKAR